MIMTFPLEIHRAKGFLSNTDQDEPVPLEDQKATKPSFNSFGPSLARQRNAIEMAFRWRPDNDPLLVVF